MLQVIGREMESGGWAVNMQRPIKAGGDELCCCSGSEVNQTGDTVRPAAACSPVLTLALLKWHEECMSCYNLLHRHLSPAGWGSHRSMKGSKLWSRRSNWTADERLHQLDAPTTKRKRVRASCSGHSVTKPCILLCSPWRSPPAAESALVWGVYHLQGRATASLQNPIKYAPVLRHTLALEEEAGGATARPFLSGNHVRISDTCSHSSCWTITAHCCGVCTWKTISAEREQQAPRLVSSQALCCPLLLGHRITPPDCWRAQVEKFDMLRLKPQVDT